MRSNQALIAAPSKKILKQDCQTSVDGSVPTGVCIFYPLKLTAYGIFCFRPEFLLEIWIRERRCPVTLNQALYRSIHAALH